MSVGRSILIFCGKVSFVFKAVFKICCVSTSQFFILCISPSTDEGGIETMGIYPTFQMTERKVRQLWPNFPFTVGVSGWKYFDILKKSFICFQNWL